MGEVRVSCDSFDNAVVYSDGHVGVQVELGAPLELTQLSIPRIGVYMEGARLHQKHV